MSENQPWFGLRWASLVALALFLSGLLACGGGSKSSTPIGGGGGGGGGGGVAVAPFFFGMHINQQSSPFPSTVGVAIAGVRLWDTHTSWATTNTGSGSCITNSANCDWTDLDFRVSQALANKADILYDFARTPTWAQCLSSDTSCGSGNTTITCAYSVIPNEGGPGECFPPNDLHVDGSGPNQHWIDWVTAVATRYKGKISYYEIWNEPNIPAMWQGTPAQLVRMAGDARCIIIGDKGCNPAISYPQKGIDPAAHLVTPAYTNPVSDIAAYLTTPLNGVASILGGSLADVVAFHGYPGANPAEQVVNIYNSLNSILVGQALQTVPVFDTEGSWGARGGVSNLSDPDQEAAFTARYLLVQQSAGIQRLYWYGWDLTSGDGTLWTSSGLTAAGVAYQQTEVWLGEATLTTPCSPNGTVWVCGYTRSGGYQAMVVWDASQTCSNGSCSVSNFTLPSSPQFTQYQDVAGNPHTISGSTVPIGAKPILIETGKIP
jgi:polysaccharide biosynthesis protein PslG